MADYTLAQQISGGLLSDVDADVRLGGLDNIDIDTSVSGKVESDVDAKVDGTLASTVTSDSTVRTDSKVVGEGRLSTDSRVASSLDLAPVAVDTCVRVELGAFPATQVHTPWEQRLGLRVLGVELFSWVLSGQTTSTVQPVPTAPQLVGDLAAPQPHPGRHHRHGHGPGGPESADRGPATGGLSIRLG